MSKLTRRQLLIFFGASAGTAVLAPALEKRIFGSNSTVAEAIEPLKFTPVRLPHPLPIYTQQSSYLPTAINQGQILPVSTDAQLDSYRVIDDVVVPPEYERYVIISWGDRVFPNKDEYFGYNSDYTGFIPIKQNPNDGYLWNNHEYVSYPLSALAPGVPEDVELGDFANSFSLVIGFDLPNEKTRLLLGEFMYNMGGSIVRISRPERSGQFKAVEDPKNRRIHGLSGLGINSQRTDKYKSVVSWGDKSYQQGDKNYLIGTGPAARDVFPLSVDELGKKIIGTGYNCSGGTSPWGTILSAEENFQASTSFYVGVTETVKPNGTQIYIGSDTDDNIVVDQTGYTPGSTGAEFGLVGEKYGWMVEVDPAKPDFRPRKHTALGRFRHENITMRVEPNKKLVAYMGDDRRGGHTYKFVSAGRVTSPTDKSNSKLFEDGTLYVARYNPDGTGRWIPLELNTPTEPIPPSVLASEAIKRLDTTPELTFKLRDALILLPRRNQIAGQTVDGGYLAVDIENQETSLAPYQRKRVADFYTSQGAMLVDAFIVSNLIGGTPTARPEDLEINPRNPREVFIAYTDGAPSSEGYPDSRIFIVAKYSPDINAAQPSGALFKIIEDNPDSTGTTFKWERFLKGGEAGCNPGDGFANVDNLAFDAAGNIWGVTDMSTSAHNGFDVGAAAEQLLISHTVVGAESPSQTDSNINVETSNLIGVFGNNMLFFAPTSGPDAGEIFPFAYGPMRCEMTGPTFVGDTLIISVQHPGEEVPFRPQQILSRPIELLNLEGSATFTQTRTLPRGSNWPSNIQGNPDGPPKPSVIGIHRKQSSGRFV